MLSVRVPVASSASSLAFEATGTAVSAGSILGVGRTAVPVLLYLATAIGAATVRPDLRSGLAGVPVGEGIDGGGDRAW
jgi:hypothetical protein